MKKFLIALCLGLSVASLDAQRVTPNVAVREQIVDLMRRHPDLHLREQMTRWYEEGKFRIQVTSAVPMLGLSMVYEIGTRPERSIPVLEVNPDFFRSTYIPPDQQSQYTVRMEKAGALYHEYVHLQNHFSGKYTLTVTYGKATPEEVAKLHWGTEFEAYYAEWQFHKRMGYPWMFFQGKFGQYPEWERFVRVVHDRISVNEKLASQLKPYWDQYMQEALKNRRR